SLDRLLRHLAFHRTQESEALLAEVLQKSAHRTVRGRAAAWLARALADRAEAARLLRQLPELSEQFRDRPEHWQRLQATDPENVAGRAEALFELIRKDYADVKRYDFEATALGAVAERGLFALRSLAISKVAPEITGKDLDGKPMRLSAYRGRV